MPDRCTNQTASSIRVRRARLHLIWLPLSARKASRAAAYILPTCDQKYTMPSNIFVLDRIVSRTSGWEKVSVITPVTESIFGPLSQTHISKSEFKNGHISRFCSVFQVIQVISSAKFFSAEEVDLTISASTQKRRHTPRFRTLLSGKETVKTFFYKCSNSGRNESTPQTQNNVSWISSKAELEISFLNSLSEMWQNILQGCVR